MLLHISPVTGRYSSTCGHSEQSAVSTQAHDACDAVTGGHGGACIQYGEAIAQL